LFLAHCEHPEAFGFANRDYSFREAENFLCHRDVRTFGIGEGYRLLGAISFYELGHCEDQHYIKLDFLFRREEWSGQKAGLGLLGHALTEIQRGFFENITLDVTTTNPHAINLYESLGFCEDLDYADDHGERMGIIRMNLQGSEVQEASNRIQNQL